MTLAIKTFLMIALTLLLSACGDSPSIQKKPIPQAHIKPQPEICEAPTPKETKVELIVEELPTIPSELAEKYHSFSSTEGQSLLAESKATFEAVLAELELKRKPLSPLEVAIREAKSKLTSMADRTHYSRGMQTEGTLDEVCQKVKKANSTVGRILVKAKNFTHWLRVKSARSKKIAPAVLKSESVSEAQTEDSLDNDSLDLAEFLSLGLESEEDANILQKATADAETQATLMITVKGVTKAYDVKNSEIQ